MKRAMMMFTRLSWPAVCSLIIARIGARASASEDHLRDEGSLISFVNVSQRCSEYERQVSCRQRPFCFCDERCEMFGDCCGDSLRNQDTKLSASSPPASKEDVGGPNLTTSERISGSYYVCVVLSLLAKSPRVGSWRRDKYTPPYGYWMVGRCPSAWGDVGTRQLCEVSADESDLMLHLPVVSSDDNTTSFRNIYCAICHGVSPTKLTSWEIKSNTSAVSALTGTNLSAGLLKALNSSQSFHRQNVEHFKHERECLDNVIGRCPANYGDNGTVESCQSHMAAVVHPTTGAIYRNWHCALCNDAIDADLNICKTSNGGGEQNEVSVSLFKTSLTAFVDFKANAVSLKIDTGVHKEIRNACVRGEFLDPFSLRCRALLCPGGGPLLKNGVCDEGRLPGVLLNMTNQDCISPGFTELEVDMCLTDNSSNSCESWDECSGLHTSPKMAILSNTRCESLERDDPGFEMEGISRCTNLEGIRLTVNATAQELDDAVTEMLAGIFDEWCPSVTFILRVVVKKGCVPASEATCPIEHITSEGSVYLTSWNKTDTLYLRDFNALYSLKETLYQVTYSQGNGSLLNVTQCVIICGSEIDLNCSLVAVNYSDIRDKILTDDNHVKIKSGGALVCQNLVPHLSSVEPLGISGHTIVTLIGIIISMLALTASFATYLMFPSLRNLPGKCVMSLIVAVFSSQLLFLITGDDVARSVSKASCTALAVLLHYACLSTFSWTNALALYLARTLGPGAQPSAASQHHNSFLYFSLFGWGAPLVIVLICLILHFIPNLEVSYGASVSETGLRSCSIANNVIEIAAFVAPISVSLLANAAFFVTILVGFSSRRAHSSSQYSKKTQKHIVRRDAFMTIKIAFLLAFSWLFGFLATGLDSEALLYVFCVLTSLQGVYVFLAFTFTKHVKALWRERLGLKRPDASSGQKGAAQAKYFKTPNRLVLSTADKNNQCRKQSPPEDHTGDSARDDMAKDAEIV